MFHLWSSPRQVWVKRKTSCLPPPRLKWSHEHAEGPRQGGPILLHFVLNKNRRQERRQVSRCTSAQTNTLRKNTEIRVTGLKKNVKVCIFLGGGLILISSNRTVKRFVQICEAPMMYKHLELDNMAKILITVFPGFGCCDILLTHQYKEHKNHRETVKNVQKLQTNPRNWKE